MSETAGNQQAAITFGQQAWKVFKRVLLEVVPPGVAAIISTWLTLKGSPPWKGSEALPILSSTFVAWGMLWGVILRSAKNVTDTTRHKSLLSKQQQLVDGLQRSAEDIAGYTTGGESYARARFVEVEQGERGQHIAQLTYMVVGKYPLYDVRLTMTNMDDPNWHKAIKAGEYGASRNLVTLGGLVPNFLYEVTVYIPLVEGRSKHRIHLNWYARNGSWYQRLELAQVNGSWRLATYVTRGVFPKVEEIFATAETGHERDETGRPVFDTSPTALG